VPTEVGSCLRGHSLQCGGQALTALGWRWDGAVLMGGPVMGLILPCMAL